MNWQVRGPSEFSDSPAARVQRFVAQGADRGRGGGAVPLARGRSPLPSCTRRSHARGPRSARARHPRSPLRRPGRRRASARLDLDRVHRPDVMDHDADRAAVVWNLRLPLLVGQRTARARSARVRPARVVRRELHCGCSSSISVRGCWECWNGLGGRHPELSELSRAICTPVIPSERSESSDLPRRYASEDEARPLAPSSQPD